MFRTLLLLVALAAPGLIPTAARAGDGCSHCGCQHNCCKTCRVECTTKKVPHTTYGCKCEDFCIPGRSQRCGKEYDCESCKCKPVDLPTCAKVHTRKKLIKYVEEKEVKAYKWVVEDLCPDCACQCGAKQMPEGATSPVNGQEAPRPPKGP